MRTLTLILIILLMSAGVIIYLQWKSAELAQRDRNLEAEEFRKKQLHDWGVIELRGLQIQSLLTDRKEDSAKYAKEQAAFKSKILALKSRVVGPAITQDTIIVFQDSLIASLDQEVDTLYIRDNVVIDSLNQQVRDFSQMNKELYIETARKLSEWERDKRKRIIIGPSVGIDYRGKPTISFGATYKLWKF